MGWCSGTDVFDPIAKAILARKPLDKKALLKEVIYVLENNDWRSAFADAGAGNS